MQYIKSIPRQQVHYVGLITVDPDPLAERLMVLNRVTSEVLWWTLISPHKSAGLVQIIVPQIYSTLFNLMVIITDDQGVYDLAGTDRVQPTLVNMADI